MTLWAWLTITLADERADALWARFEADELITGRREAEALLAETPDSVEGHFVLGQALWKEEGDLSRARRHLELALAAWEAKDAARPAGQESAWQRHLAILNALVDLSGDMDDLEDQLAYMDQVDAAYDPDLAAERAWPLMKLDRLDEAKRAVEAGLARPEPWQHVLAHNARCAIAAWEGNRLSAQAACAEAVRVVEAEGTGDVSVDLRNAAMASEQVFAFDDAARYARTAAAAGGDGSLPAWLQLVSWFLAEGRVADAVASMQGAQVVRAGRPPAARDHERAAVDAHLALLFYAMAEPERGLAAIDRAIKYPDRRGADSGRADQALGGVHFLRAQLVALRREMARERASSGGFLERLQAWAAGFLPDDSAVDLAIVRSTLADPFRLRHSLRFGLDRGIYYLQPWRVPDLIAVVGQGTAAAELEQIRSVDTMQSAVGYLQVIEAELAWLAGDTRRAHHLAQMSMSALPAHEVLLRARLATVGARASAALGMGPESQRLWETALRTDPGVIRRLGIAVPARVTHADDPLAARLGAMLLRSPRLQVVNEGGVEVRVAREAEGLSACLLDSRGNRLSCATATRDPAMDDEAWLRAIADAWHREAFSLPVRLQSFDVRSLDGTTLAGGDRARSRVRDAIQGF